VQNKVVPGGNQQQAGTLTVAVSSGAPTNIVGANLVPQIQRQTSASTGGVSNTGINILLSFITLTL